MAHNPHIASPWRNAHGSRVFTNTLQKQTAAGASASGRKMNQDEKHTTSNNLFLKIRNKIRLTANYHTQRPCRQAKEKGMNWFVPEEVIPMERRRLLLLKFEEKQRGNYLNGSMVRFAVSQIQREIHEYCCVGVIV